MKRNIKEFTYVLRVIKFNKEMVDMLRRAKVNLPGWRSRELKEGSQDE